jgi:hypothetical protein
VSGANAEVQERAGEATGQERWEEKTKLIGFLLTGDGGVSRLTTEKFKNQGLGGRISDFFPTSFVFFVNVNTPPNSSKAEPMNSYLFALVCCMGSLAAGPDGQADTSHPREARYVAYWLTKASGKSEYRMLLITRMRLEELARQMKLYDLIEDSRKKGASVPQLLDWPALSITTYKKDSIWSDGVPLKRLTRFKDLNEKDRTVEVDGVLHNYEECPLADVVRLLKAPEGKEKVHRIHPPLGGMEQTARGLRLLLEEQMKEDESKKK